MNEVLSPLMRLKQPRSIKIESENHHKAQNTTTEPLQSAGDTNPKKRKKMDDVKREERNTREKERSNRIVAQINELRTLLNNAGVIVPKGTKNAVLTEVANYITILQQQQNKSEV
jgi:hypothetical protein